MSQAGFKFLGSICKWVALGLFIATQCNSGWAVVGSVENGIYRVCVNNACSTKAWDAFNDTSSFVARVTFIVAAVFFSFSIILHTVGWFVNSEKKKNIYIAEGALDLIGGILTFCGMIAYTVLIILGYLGLSWYFAWAYSACWASAVLYILAGSFEIVAGNTKPKQQVDPQQQQGQYISSSQYQTTSVTQSGGGYQNPVAQSSVPPTQALYKDPPQRQSRVNYAY